MNQVGWYYARDNKQIGPVSAAELKRLATVHELKPEDLVWREGMTEWSLARNVRGLFEEEAPATETVVKAIEPQAAPPAAEPAATPTSHHLFDMILEGLRSRFDAGRIDRAVKFFWACGSYGLLAGMALAIVFAVILSVKTAHADRLLLGVGAILMMAVLHYLAGKSRDALDRLHATTEGSLSSTALPCCVAALSLVAPLGLVLLAVVGTLENVANLIMIPLSLAAMVVGVHVAAVALNPTALYISIRPASKSSQETVGVLAYLVQVALRSVPAAFGVGVLCGAILLAYACGEVFSGEQGLALATNTARVAGRCFWWFGGLPLMAYLALLVSCLLIGIWRAMLSLSDK